MLLVPPDDGVSVNVSPPVVSVVGVLTLGSVMGGLVPMLTTPELETIVSPSGLVQVVASPPPPPVLEVPVVSMVPVDMDEEEPKVIVCPPVVTVVNPVGTGIVFVPPMMMADPLEIMVSPFDAVHVVTLVLCSSSDAVVCEDILMLE